MPTAIRELSHNAKTVLRLLADPLDDQQARADSTLMWLTPHWIAHRLGSPYNPVSNDQTQQVAADALRELYSANLAEYTADPHAAGHSYRLVSQDDVTCSDCLNPIYEAEYHCVRCGGCADGMGQCLAECNA